VKLQDLTYGGTNEERGGLHNDIGIPLYGLGAGGKLKVDGRIDVGGKNPLEFL
jgi:hypothetical protein